MARLQGVVGYKYRPAILFYHDPRRGTTGTHPCRPRKPQLTYADTLPKRSKRDRSESGQPRAISSSVSTVVQLRAVAVTPNPLPARAFHSLERATPSGCQA